MKKPKSLNNSEEPRDEESTPHVYFLHYRQSALGFSIFALAIVLFTAANFLDYYNLWIHSRSLSNLMLGLAILTEITTSARVVQE